MNPGVIRTLTVAALLVGIVCLGGTIARSARQEARTMSLQSRRGVSEPLSTLESKLAMVQNTGPRAGSSTGGASNSSAAKAFEVASVRPSPPRTADQGPERRVGGAGVARNRVGGSACTSPRFFQVTPSRFVATNATLYGLIAAAYNVRCVSDLLSGGPEWAKSDQYDVRAIIPPGNPNYTTREFNGHRAPELQAMLKNLLADRFKLVVRVETKSMPAYNLVVVERGKLKLSASQDPEAPPAAAGEAPVPAFYTGSTTVAAWAASLNVGRPVIDKTGIEGLYDIRLEFPQITDPPTTQAETLQLRERERDLTPLNMQQQLGLKLEPTTGTFDVLVIEHAERPSEN